VSTKEQGPMHPCKKIVLALCEKLDYPAVVLDCIDTCLNNDSEVQIRESIAQSSNKFDCHSIRIVMYILIKNGHHSIIRSLLDILCQLFTRSFSAGGIAGNMDALIEAAYFYDQKEIAAELRSAKWTISTSNSQETAISSYSSTRH
jgi:hypothetical protein